MEGRDPITWEVRVYSFAGHSPHRSLFGWFSMVLAVSLSRYYSLLTFLESALKL